MTPKERELLFLIADMIVDHNIRIAELLEYGYKTHKIVGNAIRIELLKQQIKDEKK